jgi:hypothetical protein
MLHKSIGGYAYSLPVRISSMVIMFQGVCGALNFEEERKKAALIKISLLVIK